MSDESDVDFDIEVPIDSRKTRTRKERPRSPNSPKSVPSKKSRPLYPSNSNGYGNEDDSSSSPERVASRQRPKKRLAEKEWDDSSSISDGSSNDFQGKKAGAGRTRKRLSLRPNGNVLENFSSASRSSRTGSISSTHSLHDQETLKRIYFTCIQLFLSHKITPDNAFQIRFLDLMEEIIDMPDFDKNDMHGAGRALEAGARIYVCRVDKTKNSVMDLASALNLQKRKKREGEEMEREDYEMEVDEDIGFDWEDEETIKKVTKGRKLKENKNIAKDEFTISLKKHSSKAAIRREDLKKKFNDLVDEDIDFEYNSYFLSKDQDPVNKLDEFKVYAEPSAVSDAVINHVETQGLEFALFELVPNFDSVALNIWGFSNEPGSMDDKNDEMSLQLSQLPVIPMAADYLAYNPDERPIDYGLEDLEDRPNGNDTFVNDDGEGDTHGYRLADPRKISSPAEFYDMFFKNKPQHGWCGPTFVRPQFNFNRNANQNPRKPRPKKGPLILDYKVVDWSDHKTKFDTEHPKKSIIDDSTLEKWSIRGKHAKPYIGIEDSDGEFDDDFDILETDNENFIPKLFKYFLDPNRNILEGLRQLDKVEEDDEPHRFHREEEDYIEGVGFDIERHRNMDDFARDREGVEEQVQDMHFICDIDIQTQFEASYAFPASLGGVLMDTDGDLLTQASDVDSIKFTKKPKPIDMHALKRAILRFLNDQLSLQDNGNPTRDDDTVTNLSALVTEVCQTVNKKMTEHLSIAIIVAGLLHVVVDKKLFMMPNLSDPSNPLIIRRGKLWKHSENIPLPKDFNISADERNNS